MIKSSAPAPAILPPSPDELAALFVALAQAPADPQSAPPPVAADAEQRLFTLIKHVIAQHYSIRDTDPAAKTCDPMMPMMWFMSDQKWGPYVLLMSPFPEGRCFKPGADEKIDAATFDPDLHDRLKQLYCDLREVAGDKVVLIEEGCTFSVSCKTPRELFSLFHDLVDSDAFPGTERDRMNLLIKAFPEVRAALQTDLRRAGQRFTPTELRAS